MTKAEVIKQISKQTGIESIDVAATLEAFFQVVTTSMVNGDNVHFRGFGSFVNKKRARKVARNIHKNTALVVDAHYLPSFKPAKDFAHQIRQNLKIPQ